MLISVGEIITRSFDLYRDNRRLFLCYVGIMFIPYFLMMLTAEALEASRLGAFTFIANEWIRLAFFVALGIIFALISLWTWITFMRVIASRYNGVTPGSAQEELRTAKRFIMPTILVGILTALIIIGGILLLIVPGIIFAIWFAFSVQTVIFDNMKGKATLSASKNLVKGRLAKVLWRMIVPGFVFGIISAILQWIITVPMIYAFMAFVSFGGPRWDVAIINGALSVGVSLVLAPFTMAAMIILYFELKKTPLTPLIPVPEKTAPTNPQ